MLTGEIKKRNLVVFPMYSLQIEGKKSSFPHRKFQTSYHRRIMHTLETIHLKACLLQLLFYRSYFAKQDPVIYMKNHPAIHQWSNIIKSTKAF